MPHSVISIWIAIFISYASIVRTPVCLSYLSFIQWSCSCFIALCTVSKVIIWSIRCSSHNAGLKLVRVRLLYLTSLLTLFIVCRFWSCATSDSTKFSTSACSCPITMSCLCLIVARSMFYRLAIAVTVELSICLCVCSMLTNCVGIVSTRLMSLVYFCTCFYIRLINLLILTCYYFPWLASSPMCLLSP